MPRKFKTFDANEAVANVAYRLSEVIAIYPITPSTLRPGVHRSPCPSGRKFLVRNFQQQGTERICKTTEKP